MNLYDKNDKKTCGNIARFLAYVKSNLDKYGLIWLNCINESHIDFFEKWLQYFCNCKNLTFSVVESDESYKFTNGPGIPLITASSSDSI